MSTSPCASWLHIIQYVWLCLDVLEVFLDAPQRISTLPQLGHLFIRQGHVDHAAHTGAVQHTGQRQEDLLTNTIHILQKYTHMYTQLGKEVLRNTQTLTKTQYISIYRQPYGGCSVLQAL